MSEGRHLGQKDTPVYHRRNTVLVAGGAGFLGARICERYIEKGYCVYCLDNLSTGRLSNISHLLDLPQFRFFRHDVVLPITLPGPVSLIYNMACPASPPRYQIDPIHTMLTCVTGAINLLDLAGQHKARILQASTSEVYGDPSVSPQCESYLGNVNTVGPRSCYDEGKRAAETLFHDYHLARGVDIRIARIFNTYGPGMDPLDGRVVSNFVTQALKGVPITIYGRGAQTRSFCYRDDLVEGLLALMHCKKDLAAPVNIGNPGEFTIAELATQVLALTGSRSPLCYRPLPQDDPQQRRPDISVAMRELGWRPKVKLADGLRQTISYFASELRRNAPQDAKVVV
ncbi:SDR family oxidoreductase [Phaeobacter sp. HF9A]|nr:SDR family oxidoreductase [Phaeobacter sp. HF9A]